MQDNQVRRTITFPLSVKLALIAVGVTVRTAHRIIVFRTGYITVTYNVALGDNVGVTKEVSWVTIYNINPVHLVAVVEITVIRDTMSSIASPSNDQVLPIEDNPIAEDIVSIVDSMANRVAEHSGKSANVATIIDISIVSAVGSLIHCAINHNAAPVENNGVDKLATTINNALSHNTSSKALGYSTNSKAFSLVR